MHHESWGSCRQYRDPLGLHTRNRIARERCGFEVVNEKFKCNLEWLCVVSTDSGEVAVYDKLILQYPKGARLRDVQNIPYTRSCMKQTLRDIGLETWLVSFICHAPARFGAWEHGYFSHDAIATATFFLFPVAVLNQKFTYK